jgi:sulfate adenylyltransferase subunit 1
VVKQQPVKQHYTVGDEIPTIGESYHYPDDFDIIILRDSTAVKVRGKRIAKITDVGEYLYDGFPVINGRGFEIKVHSDEDVSQLLREYTEAGETGREEFFHKWAAFDTYRKVVIK